MQNKCWTGEISGPGPVGNARAWHQPWQLQRARRMKTSNSNGMSIRTTHGMMAHHALIDSAKCKLKWAAAEGCLLAGSSAHWPCATSVLLGAAWHRAPCGNKSCISGGLGAGRHAHMRPLLARGFVPLQPAQAVPRTFCTGIPLALGGHTRLGFA